MKTTTLLTMTALSALLLAAGTITTPAEAGKLRALSIQVKPKVTVRPRIRVRPRVRVNVDTQRLITRDTNVRETPPTNEANLPRQQTPPSRTATPPRQPAPANTAATPGTSEDPSSNGLTTPSNAPEQTNPTKTVNPNTVPLPRQKPLRIAGLDPEKIEDLGVVNEGHDFFLSLRELEIIRSANLFGNEDGSTAGTYNEFDGGLAGVPDGVTPAAPNITTEGALEHAAVFNTVIPTPGAGNTRTPPNDGGAERHPGGTRPGPRGNPSPHTKVDFSGWNSQASSSGPPTQEEWAEAHRGETVTDVNEDGSEVTRIVSKRGDGSIAVYTDRRDEVGRTTSATATVQSHDGGAVKIDSYTWNSSTGAYEWTGSTSRPGGRNDFSTPSGQPIPHDGASNYEDVSGLCGSILPGYLCARGANSTSSPEEKTSQPDDPNNEGGVRGNRTVARLGQEAVTNPGDGSFDTGRTTLPRAATPQDEGIVNPTNPDPDCIVCGPNR